MEYICGDELLKFTFENKNLDEAEASFFFVQIINGLEYIHKNTIVQK